MKRSKRYVANLEKLDKNKAYSVEEAVKLVKETSNSKFDGTVEVAMNLNLDTKKNDQQLRGAVVLPNGTGKSKKILVLAKGDQAKAAKEAVKAKAQAAAVSPNSQPQAPTSAAASASSFANRAPQTSEVVTKPVASTSATTPSRVTSSISDRNAPPPRSARPEPAAKPAYRSASEARGVRPEAYTEARIHQIATADWQTLKQLVQDCRACEISSSRLHPVFGQGYPPCRLMLIGEAPGAEEDRLGQPFVGPSGKLLDKILEAAKLDREKDLCIFNTLKCRPPLNATPEKAESMACRPFLERQIELIDPEVIVAMGKPAASWFFPDLKTLNPYRGKVHNLTVQGKPRKVIVTYHPSYLLRSPQEKRKAWLDWCLILDTLS